VIAALTAFLAEVNVDDDGGSIDGSFLLWILLVVLIVVAIIYLIRRM
jgi:hypothetical protein